MTRAGLAIFLLCMASPAVARAANVELKVSSLETFLHVPITVEVVIQNVGKYERPIIPRISGAVVRAISGEKKSTRMTIINGRMKQSVTASFSFEITPQRLGRIVIPAIIVRADGKIFTTKPQVILVTESETSDLLFVDLQADKESVYVGDSLDVTLQIWLRPFRDPRYKLTEREMWSVIDRNRSSWGTFAELLDPNKGSVTVRSAFRKDSDGNQRAYFVYELKKTVWPGQAGIFDAGEINILVSYPTKIGRRRDPFFGDFLSLGRASVLKSRMLSEAANVEPIEIKAIPQEGRPPYFRGAVGLYRFSTTAKPVEVAVGDPITLAMTIRGTGRLDLLRPPPLLDVPELTGSFKIPADPMAGVVEGRSKNFTQSIRPKRDNISEIPPIPFSYFDPAQEKFVTLWSDPIAIAVDAVERLAVSQIVQPGGRSTIATELTEFSGGLLANYSGMDEVLTGQAFVPGVASAAAVGCPPMLFALFWFVRRHAVRLQSDRGYSRRRSAMRKARGIIHRARAQAGAPAADLLMGALTGFIADRCNVPAGGLTRADSIAALRRHNAADDLIQDFDELLEQFENSKYARVDHRATEESVRRATNLLERLQIEKL